MSRDPPPTSNVFGDAITNGSRSEIAANAFNDINAGDKRGRAVAWVNNQENEIGNGVATLCIFYNATGLTLSYKKKNHDYHGTVKDSYPLTLLNGQWGAFLHEETASAATGSKAYVIYQVEDEKNTEECFGLMGWKTPDNGPNDTHAFCEVYEPGHEINNDEISKDIDQSAKDTNSSHCVKGVSMKASIGTGTSPLFEAYFKFKEDA